MARIIYEEFQDREGNVHYLHTEDKVVFNEDGIPLRSAMKSVQFEDYTEDTELPAAKVSLGQIIKGKKWTELFSHIKAFLKRTVTEDFVGDAFSTEKAYAPGDYFIWNNTLYRVTAEKTAGEWDDTKVEAVTVAGELQQQNENIENVNVYVGTDGKLHFTDSTGADSVLPFSSGEISSITLAASGNQAVNSSGAVSYTAANDGYYILVGTTNAYNATFKNSSTATTHASLKLDNLYQSQFGSVIWIVLLKSSKGQKIAGSITTSAECRLWVLKINQK